MLRPGGRVAFTVPLADAATTVERAVIENGAVRHLLPPEYHGDALRGMGRVLCFRDYGADIVERLRECGFATAGVEQVDVVPWREFTQPVVVATKGGA